MVNHTHHKIPGPTKHMRVDVRQKPGFSYPKPVDHVRIVEHATAGKACNQQPIGNGVEVIYDNGAACPQ